MRRSARLSAGSHAARRHSFIGYPAPSFGLARIGKRVLPPRHLWLGCLLAKRGHGRTWLRRVRRVLSNVLSASVPPREAAGGPNRDRGSRSAGSKRVAISCGLPATLAPELTSQRTSCRRASQRLPSRERGRIPTGFRECEGARHTCGEDSRLEAEGGDLAHAQHAMKRWQIGSARAALGTRRSSSVALREVSATYASMGC